MRLAIQLVISMSALTLPALVSPTTAQDSRASLAQDARTGVVRDHQGTALVRPVGGRRWTPLTRKSVLMPGDQIRTGKRGANALEVGLAGGGTLLLGPGSLAELRARGDVGLLYGEVELLPIKDGKIRVSGPGGFDEEVAERTVVRAKDRATEKLATAPRWLSGYRASTTDEWMGSLVAQVDGRDVPLTVGYHKVSVDISDQVARTTVEQSFKNTTKARLEGVFYFPLPADASISGFGMWIGGELVEADIVEKQRARAIYEDILRRKKDPGLLEWSGGNLFKARVFPIEPQSEKRIRIRYTQVLPLQGTKVRYRYALRSELLQQHPLRELSLRVAVSSATKLTKVACTTHECRTRATDYTAVVEFDAQEYTPDRDFEVVLDVDRTRALTVVPHRRGDDGYFMVMLSPPSQSGPWQRELLGDGDPLELVILADTSASMDRAAREGQRQFIESLLSMLGPRDSFQLMTCDIAVRSPTHKPVPVEQTNVDAALEFLDARNSLGWTNVDEYLARAIAAGPNTTIVYVGDGIGTTGDADPVALAQRIRGLSKLGNNLTCHAVATSSQYEKAVLEALASLGGGSVRHIMDDPARTAFEL